MVEQENVDFEDAIDWPAQHRAAVKALGEISNTNVQLQLKSALLEGELEKAQRTIGKIAGEYREKDTDLRGVSNERDEYLQDLVQLSNLLVDSSVVQWADDGVVDGGSWDAIKIINKYVSERNDEPEDGGSGENGNNIHTQTS